MKSTDNFLFSAKTITLDARGGTMKEHIREQLERPVTDVVFQDYTYKI